MTQNIQGLLSQEEITKAQNAISQGSQGQAAGMQSDSSRRNGKTRRQGGSQERHAGSAERRPGKARGQNRSPEPDVIKTRDLLASKSLATLYLLLQEPCPPLHL